jgi:hypothetical protein
MRERRAAPAWIGAIVLALGMLVLPGCPHEPEPPEPTMGTPCTQLPDCNGARTCGALKLCVMGPDGTQGFCEDGTSLVVPCPGDGTPVRPPGS